MENFVSRSRAAPVAQEEDSTKTTAVKNFQTRKTNRQPASENVNNIDIEEYAVDRVFFHVTTITGLEFIVHRYGYNSKDDIIQAPKHFPTHFVDAYWHCKRR